MTTRTLSTTISGGHYPATYTWSSDCDTNLTYSSKTGTVLADGLLTTTITFDETICLICNFYININSEDNCYGTQDSKGVRPLSCGSMVARTSDSDFTLVIPELGINTVVTSLTNLEVFSIPFQTYNVQVTVNCSPLTGSSSVNSNFQIGNGTFNWVETTSFNNPYLTINVACT